MEPILSSIAATASRVAARLGLDAPAASPHADLIAQARSGDAAVSGNALRQLDVITGSRVDTDALVKSGGKPGHKDDDNHAPNVPDPPTNGRPPTAGSSGAAVGPVDPAQWGRTCAVGGGIVGAGVGALVGATGGGVVGAGGGTLVAPGVGTIGGGAAGAVEGGTIGAAAGGTAGAVIAGGVCAGAGMIFNAVHGGSGASGSGGDPIEDAANSTNPGTRLEGQAALGLRGEGIRIEAFNKPVGPNGSIGEIDIETSRTIIEVTVKPGGKLSQITKYLTNPSLNPDGKSVILYAPNYGGRAAQDVVNAGGHVARTPQELADLVRRLGG